MHSLKPIDTATIIASIITATALILETTNHLTQNQTTNIIITTGTIYFILIPINLLIIMITTNPPQPTPHTKPTKTQKRKTINPHNTDHQHNQ